MAAGWAVTWVKFGFCSHGSAGPDWHWWHPDTAFELELQSPDHHRNQPQEMHLEQLRSTSYSSKHAVTRLLVLCCDWGLAQLVNHCDLSQRTRREIQRVPNMSTVESAGVDRAWISSHLLIWHGILLSRSEIFCSDFHSFCLNIAFCIMVTVCLQIWFPSWTKFIMFGLGIQSPLVL